MHYLSLSPAEFVVTDHGMWGEPEEYGVQGEGGALLRFKAAAVRSEIKSTWISGCCPRSEKEETPEPSTTSASPTTTSPMTERTPATPTTSSPSSAPLPPRHSSSLLNRAICLQTFPDLLCTAATTTTATSSSSASPVSITTTATTATDAPRTTSTTSAPSRRDREEGDQDLKNPSSLAPSAANIYEDLAEGAARFANHLIASLTWTAATIVVLFLLLAGTAVYTVVLKLRVRTLELAIQRANEGDGLALHNIGQDQGRAQAELLDQCRRVLQDVAGRLPEHGLQGHVRRLSQSLLTRSTENLPTTQTGRAPASAAAAAAAIHRSNSQSGLDARANGNVDVHHLRPPSPHLLINLGDGGGASYSNISGH